MTGKEKAKYIDHFLTELKDASFSSSLANLLELKPLPSRENKDKFKLLEYELEKHDLVEFVRGRDNSTLGGQCEYFISGKGLDYVMKGKSTVELFEDEDDNIDMNDSKSKLEDLSNRAEAYLELTKVGIMKSKVNSIENINLFTEWYFESRDFFGEYFDEKERNFAEFLDSDTSGNGFTLASQFSSLYPLFKILRRKVLEQKNDKTLNITENSNMLKNVLQGNLNSQINKGDSILKQVNQAAELETLKKIDIEYEKWNEETTDVLQKSFVTSYRIHSTKFQEVLYLGNIHVDKESFEHVRSKLLKVIPEKISFLKDLITELKSIPIDKILPYENQSKSLKTDQIPMKNQNNTEQFDYAIMTALEDDEMEKIIPFINVEGTVDNAKHLIQYGSLKSNSNKQIVFSSQQLTGMVDASILASELIIRFNPKFLIMPGVLGGKPEEIEIGDVVVANKVFTIDKGKISEIVFKKESESSSTGSSFLTKLVREKKKISRYIEDADQTRNKPVNIHFGSIACVRQVIDLEGFFEKNIESIDRKAIALEMESYGVSRACELLNDGKTIPLIIKAAMDNTKDKQDGAKSYASWNSAKFVQYILENDLI
jgi:nucleoside phosphorylase